MRYLLLLFLLTGCFTDNAATHSTLRKAGYTNVSTCGYAWFECRDDDTYRTCFEANNPVGERVIGTVCCGLWAKGCTIRF